jgi:hypothetical protein
MKIALRSVDFQKTPAVVAAVQSCLKSLTMLVTSYTAGKSTDPQSPGIAPSATDAGDVMGADADAQPAAPAEDTGP